MSASRDPEFEAITEGEIFEEAKDRLKIAADAESEFRPRAKEDMLFREGEGQWDDKPVTTISAEEPEITVNLTDAFVTRVVNNIKQQRPRGKCHPVGDGADIEIAEILNGIGRHIETRSEASVAYDSAADCAATAGLGYFRLVAEYISPRSFQKDLRILPIRNIFTVHMDPTAIMPSGADQNWCLISVKMKRQEYKRRYPTAENVSWNDLTRDEMRLEWEDKEAVRLAEYFRIKERADRLYQLRGMNGEESTRYQSELHGENGKFDKDSVAKSLKARGWRIDGDRDSVRRGVEWFRLNGTKVVERQQIPGEWIPVFRVEGNARDIDGHMMRRGMVRNMQGPQRMVNYGETAKIKRLGLAPQAPWVAAEGQLDGHPEWTDANQRAYPAMVYKPVTVQTSQGEVPLPPPQRQPPAQIEAGFSEFVQGMRSNLLAVAGMPNEPDADRQGVVVSGRAIDRRQYLSDQSHYQYYDNLTLAIAQCWRVMVDWIPVYFSEQRMQRIIGEDSTPEMVEINQPVVEQDETGNPIHRVKYDLSIGRYDVVMDTGPGYETKRAEGADNMIELLKVQALAEIIAKQGADLVFRSIDHPYMQELADRLIAANPDGLKKIMEGLSGRAKSIVQALSNENAALKQQLQSLQQDMKAGITKEHMAATVKAHDTNVMAQTKVHDTETRAKTAVQVAEINAAAKLIGDRAERGHEAGMAEREFTHSAEQAAMDRSLASSESAAERQMAAQQAQQAQSNGGQ